MSLATRLSVFFLAMLAAVLICFSLTLWLFQHWMLLRHADATLLGTLDALVASIEIEPDGVEWNPVEHRFDILDEGGPAVQWRVLSLSGAVIDHSDEFPEIAVPTLADREIVTVDSREDRPWRTVVDRVAVPEELAAQNDASTSSAEPDEDPDVPEYPELTIVCAIPIADDHAAMRRLALVLVVLSGIIWLVAAIFGQWLARRALQPVMVMARAAAGMTGTRGGRLPVAETGDEVEELGRSFNGLLERLQNAFDRERRFTAEASHQLRTPVTILLGQVDVALRRERAASEYRETLSEVRRQAGRLRTIVESLLSLARSDSESLPDERVDLAAWLPKHLDEWSNHPRAGDIQIHVDAASSPDVVTAAGLLAQLLDILLDNALKYSPAGTPVLIRLVRDGKNPVIEVVDAGPGIPESEAADIFRPFHRGEDAIRDGVPGLGLGLALAMRIAARLGIGLEYQSMTPDAGGSRFRIVFGDPPLRSATAELSNRPDSY